MSDHPGEGQAGPGAESLAKARDVVELWENAYNNCPHYPGTRACECKVCLEGLIASALRASEAALAERTKERDDAQESARKHSECADHRWQQYVEAMKLRKVAETALEAARAEATKLTPEWLAFKDSFTEKHRTTPEGFYYDGLVRGRAEATKAEDALRQIDGFGCAMDALSARKALAAIRAPRQPEPETPRCGRCGSHHQGGLNYHHAFVPAKSRSTLDPPSIPDSRIPNAPPSEELRPRCEMCEKGDERYAEDGGTVMHEVWMGQEKRYSMMFPCRAVPSPEPAREEPR